MKRLIKTLFGDLRTAAASLAAILVGLGILATPARPAAGLVLPILLLIGAGYLARH